MLSACANQMNMASSSLEEDPFKVAGGADPASLAVCKVHSTVGEGTGFLTKIDSHLVVLTAAHVGVPTMVSFPTHVRQQDGSYVDAPHVRSFTELDFQVKKSIQSKKHDLQVLYLDGDIESLPYLELATATPSLDARLKTIGYGWYCTAASGGYFSRILTSKIYRGLTTPVKFYMPPNSTALNESKTDFTTKTFYANYGTLETHPYSGFSGAPVMDEDSQVVSLLTDSTKELLQLCRKLNSNLGFFGFAIAAWWKGYVPKNVFAKIALAGVIVQSFRMAKRAIDCMQNGEVIHLNLQHPEIQSWLKEVVASN